MSPLPSVRLLPTFFLFVCLSAPGAGAELKINDDRGLFRLPRKRNHPSFFLGLEFFSRQCFTHGLIKFLCGRTNCPHRPRFGTAMVPRPPWRPREERAGGGGRSYPRRPSRISAYFPIAKRQFETRKEADIVGQLLSKRVFPNCPFSRCIRPRSI